MRLVLYTEGPGEGSTGGLVAAANAPLKASEFGPGHVLIERVLREHLSITDVEFVAPLRDRKGRTAVGSALHDAAVLRQLLTWPLNSPDLAVVLVDADGRANERRTQLETAIQKRKSHHPPVAVIVCIEEFESWLLADPEALRKVFGSASGSVVEPEKLSLRDAKQRWNGLCSQTQTDERALRHQVIATLSLETLKARCRSFEDTLQALSSATVHLTLKE